MALALAFSTSGSSSFVNMARRPRSAFCGYLPVFPGVSEAASVDVSAASLQAWAFSSVYLRRVVSPRPRGPSKGGGGGRGAFRIIN